MPWLRERFYDEYRRKALHALEMQFAKGMTEVESELKSEMEQGADFFRQVVGDEQTWIASGKNLDVEFANKYYGVPAFDAKRTVGRQVATLTKIWPVMKGSLMFLLAVGASIGVLCMRKSRRKPATRTT